MDRIRSLAAAGYFVGITLWLTWPFSAQMTTALERALVHDVVVHYDTIPQTRRRHLEAEKHRYRERIPLRFRSGDDAVYEIVASHDAPS